MTVTQKLRMKTLRPLIIICLILLTSGGLTSEAQIEIGSTVDSGGPLMKEQAAYDVKSYDLDLRLDPVEQSIKGVLTALAVILEPTGWFVLDLDPRFQVDAITLTDASGKSLGELKHERRAGKLWISFPTLKRPGENVRVRIAYAGKPRVAPYPPWRGGFIWSKTLSGEPWVGVACQGEGADIWFPVKDHPSDKPETTSLHFTVPQPLVAASNGRLQSVVTNQDGTQTFNWFISSPISNYNITLNVAPYKTIEDKFVHASGETVPITFWVLPESYDKGAGLIKKVKDYLRFFETYLGPYPFRSEKVGIVQTTYLGMEHQTIIAYGNNFRYDVYGFDWLMFHELGHEWWGNLVTASDWRDSWLHEGFQSFMDTLYLERLQGKDAYMKGMTNRIRHLRNMQPVAPRESRTSTQMFWAAPDYVTSDSDIYDKGGLILHTLRRLIGDKAFFAALRRMAYPDRRMERVTNGQQVRFGTTDEFIKIAESTSGMKLGWFFEVYLRQSNLPRLVVENTGNKVSLRWEAPANLTFPMPVDVQVGGKTKRYEMKAGKTSVPIKQGQSVTVDPENWILKAP